MKFIVDAQLPLALSSFLNWRGLESIHTDDLPNKEKTTDEEIRKISVSENRIVITKDTDFLDSHLVKGVPPKLLLVTTGNIVNKKLMEIFQNNISDILIFFENHSLVELDNFEIRVLK